MCREYELGSELLVIQARLRWIFDSENFADGWRSSSEGWLRDFKTGTGFAPAKLSGGQKPCPPARVAHSVRMTNARSHSSQRQDDGLIRDARFDHEQPCDQPMRGWATCEKRLKRLELDVIRAGVRFRFQWNADAI